MAIKLGFSMDDLHYFSIKDITEMFDIYSESINIKGNKSSGKTYSGSNGLLDFVRGD